MRRTGLAIPFCRQCNFFLLLSIALVLGQTSGKLDPVVVMKDDISRIKTMMQAVAEQLERFNSLYQSKLENRLTDGATSIAHIDSNVKNLQERAHVWDTFKLHVSAWNDHIKALDTKLTTVNSGAAKVDLAEEKIDTLIPLESKMSKLHDRLTEADDKLSDIQKKLVAFPSITTTGTEVPRLLTEFTSRGVLSSLKDIESKINRLVRISSNTNNTLARGRHLELQLQCPSQKALNDKMNDMAGKIDYIHDRVDSRRQLRRRDEKDSFQDGGSLWRQMVYPLRRANHRLENIDKVFSQIQKLSNFSGFSNKDKAAMAAIRNNVVALQKCFSEQEEALSDVARSTENAIAEARTEWQDDCVSDARYNQRIQQFRNDLVQLLFETFKSHFDTNFEEMNQVCFGSKEKANDENTAPVLPATTISNKANNETEMYAETKGVEEETKINVTDKLGPGCEELHAAGKTESGLYVVSQKRELNEAGRDFNMRYCDMTSEGGGWTVIQRRGDFGTPRQNFSLSWLQYKEGFGDLRKEFWFGNDYIHRLTNENDMILRIELWDFDDNFAYAEYETFRVDSEEEQYRLWIEGYQGNATDSLGSHNGYSFSTYDRDNDEAPPCCPCATTYGGGWWFYSCFEANLNGDYMEDPTDNDVFRGIIWEFWKGDYSLKKAEMKLRPRAYNPPVAAPAAAILSAATPVRSGVQSKP